MGAAGIGQLLQMLMQHRMAPLGGLHSAAQPPSAMPGAASPMEIPTVSGPPGSPGATPPNMTASAMQGPLQGPAPSKASNIGQTEWQTKGGRAQAITEAAVESFSNAFKTGEQKQWQRRSSQAEQTWQSYRGLQQALAEAQDPKAKQAIQQQLDAMMEDKNVQKIMKKAHQDPTSAEGVGLQRAMAQSKQEAKEQAELEEMHQKMVLQAEQAKAEQARAEQEKAHADLYTKQAAQEGQVTPRVAAEEQTRKDIATGQEKSRKEVVDAQIQQQKDKMKTWADVENKRTEMMRQTRLAAINKKLKTAKGNTEMVKYFKVESDNLNKQLDQVDKQVKGVQDSINKTSWIRRGHLDTLNKQLPALSMQRAKIEKQLADLQSQMQLAQQHNAVQFESEQESSSMNMSTQPPADAPITVAPEDMQ
jgi:hypothetical protein